MSDVELDAAVQAAIVSDVPDADVIGWAALAVHVRPDGEVMVWWTAADLSDQQLVALAQSLIDEVRPALH